MSEFKLRVATRKSALAMAQTTMVAEAIVKEQERQNSHIELIASENFVSDQVMELRRQGRIHQGAGSCLA